MHHNNKDNYDAYLSWFPPIHSVSIVPLQPQIPLALVLEYSVLLNYIRVQDVAVHK